MVSPLGVRFRFFESEPRQFVMMLSEHYENIRPTAVVAFTFCGSARNALPRVPRVPLAALGSLTTDVAPSYDQASISLP